MFSNHKELPSRLAGHPQQRRSKPSVTKLFIKKPKALRSKHFELHQLAEGTFAAIAKDGGSAICNSGIVDLGGQVVVFDTFLTPQAALDLRHATEELFGRAPHIVVNSHYHNDHIWG